MGSVGLIIPILIFLIPIIAIWTGHQQKMAKLRAQESAPDTRQLDAQAQQIRDLEDRVRVLERIVTDGGYSVAAEIEALRDVPASSSARLSDGVTPGLEKERI